MYETLERLGIPYREVEHEPAFTVEEMESLPFIRDIGYAKNLFLRDAKGRRHFLVVVRKDTTVNLDVLAGQIGSTRLSFASEKRLWDYLKLTKGSVSPLGILNDQSKSVEVILDERLKDADPFGVHPNINSATVILAFSDLVGIIRDHGNPMRFFLP